MTSWWLGFDVFSQFTVQFIIVAVACAAGLVLPRHGRKMAAGLLVLGLVAVGLWARMHQSAGFEQWSSGGVLRVMSYNSWTDNHRLKAMEAEVRRQRADIIGMVEFSTHKEVLHRRLRDIYPHSIDCNDIPFCYLGLFSRWPIKKVKARSLWAGPPYLHVKVHAPGGAVDVFVVHTLRFPWLGSQLKQVRAMRRIIRQVKGPVIVMGDFNSTPFSVMHRAFLHDSNLTRLTFLPTWPSWAAGLPQIAIDHVFVSPHWRLVRGPFIGASAGSDHFPVIVELRRTSAR